MKKLIFILILGIISTSLFAQTSDTLTVTLSIEETTSVEWFTEGVPSLDNWEYNEDEKVLNFATDNLSSPVWIGILTNKAVTGDLSIKGSALSSKGEYIPITVAHEGTTHTFGEVESQTDSLNITDEGDGHRVISVELTISINHNDIVDKTAPADYTTTLTAIYSEI